MARLVAAFRAALFFFMVDLPQYFVSGTVVLALAAKEEPTPVSPRPRAIVSVDLWQTAATSHRFAHVSPPFLLALVFDSPVLKSPVFG